MTFNLFSYKFNNTFDPMKSLYCTKVMVLCDFSILYFYNEIRNTTGCVDIIKARSGYKLGIRVEIFERMKCKTLNMDYMFGFRFIGPFDNAILNSIFLNAADSYKSDIFSPYSFCVVFCVLLQITEGNTKKSLLKIIESSGLTLDDSFYKDMSKNFKSLVSECTQIGINNFLCHDQNVKIDVLLKKTNKQFNVEEVIIDFKENYNAIEVVGDVISDKTCNLFSNFFSPKVVKPLYLINTVYFKGAWLNQFNSKDTSFKNFYNNTNTCKVPMMKQKGVFKYIYADGLNFLRIDLKGCIDSLCLIIVLPDTDIYISELLYVIYQSEFKRLITGECSSYNVDLEMPKFKIETECNLNNVFKKFLESDLMDKDLDLGVESKSLESTKINVRQETVIEFTESGICTNVKYSKNKSTIIGTKNIYYHCNRPFVFFLFDTRYPLIEDFEGLLISAFPILVGRYTGQ
ncbi:serpin-type proteinase inhibitor 23 [Vairimorpha necatrix]|uniref:Serpin-type proteinase inhibitor 23 n=1 Tax=Vairimorpha necatrix TaxID=6039 RepID=A0AAX4JEP8_9MICR